MDNNDSNIKSQLTGGLKLMTVFIAVLALHVVVIGGFTVYHLLSGGSADADLATTDKTHKDLKNADGATITETTLPDAGLVEKPALVTPTTAPAEVATIPANTPAPEQDAAAPAMAIATTPAPTPVPAPASTPAPVLTPAPAPPLTPAPALTLTAPTSAPLAPPPDIASQGPQTPTGPISSTLTPPPDSAPSLTAPLSAGPVHMPAMTSSAVTPKPEHSHQQIYTVKITDSYKKIAHAHHITVAELKEANHIKGDVLHTGQKLIIPSENKLVAENATASTAPSTLHLDSAPAMPIVNQAAAPITTGLSSTSTTVASTGLHHHLYTVVKGDTLTKIAHKFKTTPSAIMAENGITNPTKLSIGEKLKIPSKESRSAKVTPPASTQPTQQVQAKSSPADGQLANFTP